MAAPKGNRFWEARSSHGRKPIFESPDDLWNASLQYFEWVAENPLMEVKAYAYQGDVKQDSLPKMRAMTIMGLCNFLDINQRTWFDYAKRDDFIHVCSRVNEIIRQQKFEGAAAELLNPSIIARDLGLVDKQEYTGADGKDLIPEAPTDQELARRLAFILTKGLQNDG